MEMPVFKAIQTLLCALSLLLVPSCGHNANETKGIENFANDFVTAWNQHNSKAIADLWTADGDFLSPWSQTNLIKGREAIEKNLSNEYQDRMKNATIKLTIDKIRLIDPETAFIDANFTLSGMNIAGVKAEPLNNYIIFLLVQQDGKWKIQIARPY
jgi:uncharacterized protein (TIGR02246 family)